MQRVITGKYFSVQCIVSYSGYTCICVYHKYSGTLDTIDRLCPLNKEKVIFQRIQLESVLLSNAKWDSFIPSKVFISFVELSVLYYLRYM